MSKRYRCSHCGTTFTNTAVRDCCLPAAVARQRQLLDRLAKLSTGTPLSGGFEEFMSDLLRNGRP